MSTPTKKDPPITLHRVLHDPVLLLAVGFGSGLAPFAPGTFGTLVGVVLVWLLALFSDLTYVAVTIVVCVLGVKICALAAERLGVHDHAGIVWDEIAGFMIAMMLVPVTALNLAVAFVAFRCADIVKPWPANQIDRHVSGGVGIMLDDIVAGVYAALATLVISSLISN